MTALVTIIVSGEPQGKGRPRFSRQSGRAFTPANTRSYEARLALAAQEAMDGRAPFEGPLCITMHAMMPVPMSKPKRWKDQAMAGLIRPTTKPDADNLAKCCDALNEIVFRDDKQAVDLTVRKFYSDRAALIIEVHEAATSLPSRNP